MDHESSSSKAKIAFRFIKEEVKVMEEKLKPRTTSHPDRVLMRELALQFSESRSRAGTTSPVTPEQVLHWFCYHRYNKSTKKVPAMEAPPAPRSMTECHDWAIQRFSASAPLFRPRRHRSLVDFASPVSSTAPPFLIRVRRPCPAQRLPVGGGPVYRRLAARRRRPPLLYAPLRF
ncbi:hypothetical protein PVAP13_4NG085934 [Panicum virgatum]|uniref:Homeobox domain-containing protein n=1 Tax=Panicum virgatum TaxID=38727 RepID=A0A8T0T7F3_PANVG|nr:hypothetical protein PVAP13_4NG085934 [Panicum virgatum]